MRVLWLVPILTGILGLVLGDVVCHRNYTDSSETAQRSGRILSRRRRLTFPMGSTFVITLTNLQAIQLPLPANWNLDLEFDVIWPIPNQESFKKKVHFKKPWILKRRHRRELYANFEAALDSAIRREQFETRNMQEVQLVSESGSPFLEVRLSSAFTERLLASWQKQGGMPRDPKLQLEIQNLPGRQCILRTICEAKSLLSPPGISFIEDAIRLIVSNFENASQLDSYDIAYRTERQCDAAYSCPFSLLQLLLFNLYSNTLS